MHRADVSRLSRVTNLIGVPGACGASEASAEAMRRREFITLVGGADGMALTGSRANSGGDATIGCRQWHADIAKGDTSQNVAFIQTRGVLKDSQLAHRGRRNDAIEYRWAAPQRAEYDRLARTGCRSRESSGDCSRCECAGGRPAARRASDRDEHSNSFLSERRSGRNTGLVSYARYRPGGNLTGASVVSSALSG